MEKYYSDEKHVQVLVSLLKQHNIRKIIASPGTTNSGFVTSLKYDGFFEIYSSVDERSAAYLACGLASESGEPVVITCTGATASRNYLPGLTEAFYRKLPVLAVTGTQAYSKIGHHVAQVIDRSVLPKDVAKLSISLPIVKDDADIKDCEIKVNQAILELTRNGGGPVHINLPTTYTKQYTLKELPIYRCIKRYTSMDRNFPPIPDQKKVGVFVGSHKKWTKDETEIVDQFCESNNGVVFCDHTSGYNGNYKVNYALVAGQIYFKGSEKPDILLHIGEISGDYSTLLIGSGEIWRINEDGEIRDTFGRLKYVFQMSEKEFFKSFLKERKKNTSYYDTCKKQYEELFQRLPDDIPFSNIWIASQLNTRIPKQSTLHFGILNSLRSWNFFEVDNSIITASNVGGFGIDGGLSSLIGASLFDKSKLYFCVIGDLAFFYDINVLGNRHTGNNLRILLVNNGKGVEFRQYNHYALQFNDGDEFIAAAGHFGNKSPELVKNFAENLGYKYLSASSKKEFLSVYEEFVNPDIGKQSIIFEVFTDADDESLALEMITNIEEKPDDFSFKEKVRSVIGDNSVNYLKKVLKK